MKKLLLIGAAGITAYMLFNKKGQTQQQQQGPQGWTPGGQANTSGNSNGQSVTPTLPGNTAQQIQIPLEVIENFGEPTAEFMGFPAWSGTPGIEDGTAPIHLRLTVDINGKIWKLLGIRGVTKYLHTPPKSLYQVEPYQDMLFILPEHRQILVQQQQSGGGGGFGLDDLATAGNMAGDVLEGFGDFFEGTGFGDFAGTAGGILGGLFGGGN